MKEKELIHHSFTFNPESNGGESVTLGTHIRVEDGDVTLAHELSMNSYGNIASFFMYDCFTPEKLRKLADELALEIELAKQTNKLNNENLEAN